ncbi:MAG: TIGR04219 family outer membrane beta-barrel protein [Nitrospirae bacterium]|nr:MAG: TIGR04219 family outer membrane beta-barrel protein [Nitrospirota bacterium]
MKKFYLYSMALMAFLALFPLSAGAIGFELSLGYWSQKPSGYVSYKPVSATDRLDVKDDLGYDDESKPFLRAKLYTPLMLPNIYFVATPMKFEADSTLKRQFHFGDITVNIDEPFSSEVKLTHYDIALFYRIPLIRTATLNTLNIELGLNARVVDFSADVRTTLQREHKSMTLPVPMLYAGVQFRPVKLINLEAEARAVAYGSNHYYDFMGRVRVNPFGPLFIAGGYRYEDIKIDHEDIDSKVKFKGPFVEVGVSF